MKTFFRWLSFDEGWKCTLAVVYAVICIFDFVIVPSRIGITRQDLIAQLNTIEILSLDPAVQIQILEAVSRQHMPFTLHGGGLFHIAFGALLTGSAVSKHNHS